MIVCIFDIKICISNQLVINPNRSLVRDGELKLL